MFVLIGGFFKLTFLFIIAIFLIFKLCEKFNLYLFRRSRRAWEKRRALLIKECEKILESDPEDEEAADLYKRLKNHYLITCLYDYIIYLQVKSGGWQVCPSCKFPAAKNMLVCNYCDYVTPEGIEKGRQVLEWANS